MDITTYILWSTTREDQVDINELDFEGGTDTEEQCDEGVVWYRSRILNINAYISLSITCNSKNNVRNGFYAPKNPRKKAFYDKWLHGKIYALASQNCENSRSYSKLPSWQPSWICFRTPHEYKSGGKTLCDSTQCSQALYAYKDLSPEKFRC